MKKIEKSYPIGLPPSPDIFSCPFGILSRYYALFIKSQFEENRIDVSYQEQKKHRSPERRNVAPQFP